MHRLHRCIAGPIFSTSTATSVRDVGPDPPNRQRPRLRRIKMPITKSEYELSSPVPGFIEVIHPGVLVCVLVGVLASVAEIRHPHRSVRFMGDPSPARRMGIRRHESASSHPPAAAIPWVFRRKTEGSKVVESIPTTSRQRRDRAMAGGTVVHQFWDDPVFIPFLTLTRLGLPA